MTTQPKDPCLEAFVREFGERPEHLDDDGNNDCPACHWIHRLAGFRAAWLLLHADAESYDRLRNKNNAKLLDEIDAARKGEAP